MKIVAVPVITSILNYFLCAGVRFMSQFMYSPEYPYEMGTVNILVS